MLLPVFWEVSKASSETYSSEKPKSSLITKSVNVSTPKQKNKSESLNSKIGIVTVNKNDVVCLKTENSDLAENTPITIVASLFFPPQEIVLAKVDKKLKSSCENEHFEQSEDFKDPSYYSLKFPDSEINDKDDVNLTFAIINPAKPAEVHNGLVSVDINSDGKVEYFRHCASYEGTHLTIWTGKPLEGKRIWHTYVYLGYDTEANCKKADYEGTN